MRTHWRASCFLAVGLVLPWLQLQPGLAQSCAYRGAVAPAPTTRLYEHQELGFAFEIPANYRAMGLSNQRVAFYDPATFEHVQCAVRSGRTPQGSPAAVLDWRFAPLQEPDLQALTQRVRPWLVLYRPTFEAIAPNAVPALRYQYMHQITGNTVQAMSFRSADGRWLVTIEGAPNSSVLPLALMTLRFASDVPQAGDPAVIP